jgi:predicted XRE-type DNA-binding protein
MNAHSRERASYRQENTNLYAELGYRAPESMLVKAQLVTRIAELLAEKRLTQTAAATLFGVPQPKLSKMLRGQFRGVSELRLLRCLMQLGQDVHTIVRPRQDQRSTGTVSVTFG